MWYYTAWHCLSVNVLLSNITYLYLRFLMCNGAVNQRINCGLCINRPICCCISDFRSVVNFNYVSSPKFVPNQKDFIISAASVSRFWSCQSFLKLFNITQWRSNQITGTLKTNPKQQLPPSCLFKDNNFCHAFYFMVSVCITFLKYMCKSNKS